MADTDRFGGYTDEVARARSRRRIAERRRLREFEVLLDRSSLGPDPLKAVVHDDEGRPVYRGNKR